MYDDEAAAVSRWGLAFRLCRMVCIMRWQVLGREPRTSTHHAQCIAGARINCIIGGSPCLSLVTYVI